MAGEISPDIMFGESHYSGAWIVADVCKWIHMGENGCIHNEGSKNKGKRVRNGCLVNDFVL